MASAFAYYYIPNATKMSTVLSRIFAGLFSYLGNFEKIPENCRIKRLHKTAALDKSGGSFRFFGPEHQLSGDLMGGRLPERPARPVPQGLPVPAPLPAEAAVGKGKLTP